MPDGPYLELLSFTHPESHYPPSTPSHDARLHQPWANKLCGWVAFAFLGTPRITPTLSTVLNERLRSAGSSTRYTPEVSGGRTRLDGVELRWEITAPERWGEKEGGTRLPFFCGDVTPRELRVRVPVHLPQSELFFFFFFFFSPSTYTKLSPLFRRSAMIGADSTGFKHRPSERRAEHRASPRARPAQRIRRSRYRIDSDRGRGADREFGERAGVAA